MTLAKHAGCNRSFDESLSTRVRWINAALLKARVVKHYSYASLYLLLRRKKYAFLRRRFECHASSSIVAKNSSSDKEQSSVNETFLRCLTTHAYTDRDLWLWLTCQIWPSRPSELAVSREGPASQIKRNCITVNSPNPRSCLSYLQMGEVHMLPKLHSLRRCLQGWRNQMAWTTVKEIIHKMMSKSGNLYTNYYIQTGWWCGNGFT